MAGQAGQGSDRASNQGSKVRPGTRRVAQWTRDYVRLPGIPDEYIAQDGEPRAVWSRFFDAFAALTPAEIERRFGSADRHLRVEGLRLRVDAREPVCFQRPSGTVLFESMARVLPRSTASSGVSTRTSPAARIFSMVSMPCSGEAEVSGDSLHLA